MSTPTGRQMRAKVGFAELATPLESRRKAGAAEKNRTSDLTLTIMLMNYYAHSTGWSGKYELLANHLADVAKRTGRFAEAFDAGDWGVLLGR